MKKLICIGLYGLFVMFSHSSLAQVTLWYNAKGYGFDPQRALVRFEALAVEKGKVLEVGDNAIQQRYPDAKQVDLKGKSILPGLIDAHAHFMGLGYSLLEADVRDIRSKLATVKAVASFAKQNPDLDWVRGGGWNQVLWPENDFPNATDLDEFIQNRPVWLERVDGHAGWANSLALKMAGIDESTLDPPGGQILRDSKGKPSGILIDNAMQLIQEKLPKYDANSFNLAFEAAQSHLLELGITSLHDAGIEKDVYDFYQHQLAEHQLKLRIYAMIAGWDTDLLPMLEKGFIQDDKDLLSIRSVKLVADGALGSRGAALLEPYSDDHDNTGLMVTSEQQLSQLYEQIIKRGFQLNVHAIGDRANRIALDQYAATYQKVGGRDLRHRIEHAQIINPADIPRFKQLNLIASMQPTHATSDKNMAGDRLGKERLKGAYAWHSMLAQGTIVAAGSDFPVELANPFFGLHAAVTRQDRDNQPRQGWLPEQKMTLEQALRAFTADAAYAAFQEDRIGSLSKGQWADFIVVDRDIFAIPEQDLWKPKVLQTWVAGEQQF
ncbi:amidohydrolase [Neptunicella sp. SCSIO 80796]|uniref:amidohydrolase n=1 Tax=Neptunicella plasticusilytica TaxID=3117012 RepID=UPI003A4E1CAF